MKLTGNQEKEKIFKTTFFEYHTRLCQYAFQYVYDREAAQDIVQDVFCELWLQMEQIDLSYSLNSLLYTYTRNKAINYLEKAANNFRNNERIEELSPDNYIKQLIIDDQLENLHTKDMMEALEKGIQFLPDQCKKVFILSRKEGLKNKEIAIELGISIKAVEKHITKALSLLKEHLIKNGFSMIALILLHLKG